MKTPPSRAKYNETWLPPVAIRRLFRDSDAAERHRGSSEVSARVSLRVGSTRTDARTTGIVHALLGVLLGIGIVLIGHLFMGAFSLWDSGTNGRDVLLLYLLGAAAAAGGIFFGYGNYLPWRPEFYLSADDSSLRVSYVGFRQPLEVPRSLVRAVAIDPTPAKRFTNKKRFPVLGNVPKASFADALSGMAPGGFDWSRWPVGPWRLMSSRIAEGAERLNEPEAQEWRPPEQRDPAVAGYAASAWPEPEPVSALHDAYLFSGDGAALPVLRFNMTDVPNVAILFHEPVGTAGPSFFLDRACHIFKGGRDVKGVMVTVTDPDRVREMFEPWDVLRPVTAADVGEEGLVLAKPLRGWRIAAFAALLILPLLLRALVELKG